MPNVGSRFNMDGSLVQTLLPINNQCVRILNAVAWLVIYGDSRKIFSCIDGFLEEEKCFFSLYLIPSKEVSM